MTIKGSLQRPNIVRRARSHERTLRAGIANSMPDESLATLVGTNSRLVDTNSRLEQRNAVLEEQAHTLTHLAERLPRAEEEAKNARADKASLEQEIRLGGAQKAAKRINTLISVVPNTIMVVCNITCLSGFIMIFTMVLPIGIVWVPWTFLLPFMALFVISFRPANTKTVRTITLQLASFSTAVSNYAPLVGFFLVYSTIESLRPYPTAVMATMTSIQAVFMLDNCVFPRLLGFVHNICGEAEKMTKREKSKLTWAFMVEELGSERKACMALVSSLGFFYPLWEGAALATKCEWPFSSRYMVMQVIKHTLVACGLNVFLMPIVPIYFLSGGTEADFMPPPRMLANHNFTSSELQTYMDAARTEVLVLACFSPALFAVILVAYLFRPRIHAWLIRLATAGDAGRAAGVAAMIGKLEPQAVLSMSRRTFTGLPFDVLCKEDFASNQDTGLNAKARRCRLGEVDAFLSHSWHDNAESKWQTLSSWAAEFAEAQGRSPVVWLDKACLNQLDIESQLACLPVYLSGCQRLVVLAGDTFHTRIWCIIEIFTFLRMGGTPDRVTLLPLLTAAPAIHRSPSAADEDAENMELGRIKTDDSTLEAVFERFRTFEVSATKAFKEDERQHLLGVIEAGFGDLEVFDSLVQSLFDSLRQEHTSHTEQAKRSVPSRGGKGAVVGVPRQPGLAC